MTRVSVGLLLGVSGLTAAGTGPYSARAPQPAADFWMYPHTPTPGSRTTASTFSYLPSPGVDDRYGQFVIKFDTQAAGIPAGLGPLNYDIHTLTFTAVYASSDNVVYDATEDALASLGSAPTLADPDAGRPLELHGTSFRNGFSATTFQENSPYGNRNAYASSFNPFGVASDVTNNVTQASESYPWAIGKISSPVDLMADPVVYQPLPAGEVIPIYSRVTFEIDLTIPGVADYVRQGLHQGCLWLTLSSFHPVTGPESSGFPAYFTLNHPEQALYGDVAPTLDLAYSLPLRIASFSRPAGGNAVTLTWNGSPGFSYVVEGTEDLAQGRWSPLGAFTPSTPSTLTWNGNSPSTHAFFRIARTQQQ